MNATILSTALSIPLLLGAVNERLASTDTYSVQQEVHTIGKQMGLSSLELEPYVSRPLWAIFGWEQVKFGTGDLPALPQWVELMRLPDGRAIYEAAWNDCMALVENEFGLPIGKGDLGIRQIASSLRFDLGKDQWRLIDMLRAPTRRPENPYLLELDPGKIKAATVDMLGDGLFAVVRPETIGWDKPMGLRDEVLVQCRAFIWEEDEQGAICRKIFKGLIKVSNVTKLEGFAFDAQYGTAAQARWGEVVEIHPMTDTVEYSPAQGRVSDQLMTYAGVSDAYTRLRPGLNLQLSQRFDGARMVLAGAPIGMLPATEAMRVAREAFDSACTLPMGVRRKVAPGMTLKPFQFRAPATMSEVFVVGRTYTIQRDPALPDGTSVWSGECVGFTWGNFFEVPTSSSPNCKGAKFGVWEQGGGDFDGDDALVLPHVSHGGVILGFNDRPEEEQRKLMEVSSAGRKGAGFKVNYENGNVRWMNARIATAELGMYDFAARKVTELFPTEAGKLMAASLKPLIQRSVDAQKRNIAKPEEPAFLQKIKGRFMMQIMKAMKKPSSDFMEDKASFYHQWDVLEAQAESALELLEGDYKANPAKRAAVSANVRWAHNLFMGIKRQLMSVNPKEVQGRMYPRVANLPVRDIAEWQAARQANIEEGFATLEDWQELAQLEGAIHKARQSGRTGLAQAIELYLQQFIAQQDVWEQAEYAAQIQDPQLWVKVAPQSVMRAFFMQPDVKRQYAAVHELPGVVVSGLGSPLSRPVGSRVTNQREMMFAGLELQAGQLVIEQEVCGSRTEERVNALGGVSRRVIKNTELVAKIHGFEVARVVGNINKASELISELESAAGKLGSVLSHGLDKLDTMEA